MKSSITVRNGLDSKCRIRSPVLSSPILAKDLFCMILVMEYCNGHVGIALDKLGLVLQKTLCEPNRAKSQNLRLLKPLKELVEEPKLTASEYRMIKSLMITKILKPIWMINLNNDRFGARG